MIDEKKMIDIQVTGQQINSSCSDIKGATSIQGYGVLKINTNWYELQWISYLSKESNPEVFSKKSFSSSHHIYNLLVRLGQTLVRIGEALN